MNSARCSNSWPLYSNAEYVQRIHQVKTRPLPEGAAQSTLHSHPVIDRIFASRGVTDPAELDYRLHNLGSPETMLGLVEAGQLLADTLKADKRIVVVGDFDADGATSCALASLVLSRLGARVNYLVPNRFEFGYGLTPEIVAVAARATPDLIVTVDNGIASVDGVRAAQDLGIKVLLTDHHLPGAELPSADVIVNPNQVGCGFPSKNLAGVGVIFYVLSQLRAELRQRNWFFEKAVPEPSMAEYLDLVALGTVADVVPLDANNRTLIAQGMARIRAGRTRPGITALLKLSGREPTRAEAADLAFAVGPRLNAAGRLDDMSTGIECLLAADENDAFSLAGELDAMNRERRQIEANMQRSALEAMESLNSPDETDVPTGICLYDPSWHQGVIGILAARVKERFHRPVVAFADADAGWIKGSARSIPGFHIRDALDAIATAQPDLLSRFGGHAMAAGLSLKLEDFERFSSAFAQEAARKLSTDDLQSVLLTDGELPLSDHTLQFAQLLMDLGPWGQQFPEPVFQGHFEIVQQRLVGEKHLKMVLRSSEELIDAIAFNVDTDIWPAPECERVNLCYKLSINSFRGRTSLQLMVEHLAPVPVERG